MITTQTLTTGIHAFLTQKIKELDMQLRKPATAILALALSAGLAQADDAAPAAGTLVARSLAATAIANAVRVRESRLARRHQRHG